MSNFKKNESQNTGNYRLSRQQTGIRREILSYYKTETDVINALKNIQNELNWEYYCEKEVFYIDTHSDENHNLFNSSPTWIRITVKL